MKIKLLLFALLTAASFNSLATETQEKPSPTNNHGVTADYLNPFGGDFFVEFDQFVYGLFISQTNETALPADVNDVPFIFSYDYDVNGFYMIFLLP